MGADDIVVDSHYDHERFGRVTVKVVDDGEVGFTVENETVVVDGHRMPRGVYEDVDEFIQRTEPADITFTLGGTSADSSTPAPGHH